ncbi:lysophospholipase L1-like esterase [Pontibacter ummariensis]|uniref:Lysophospholipase L1 n=1 Tax=Pontibacter ummariensis TaxID=1610492 RepID=A0A239H2Q4_9BACT|nr:rhamnogalacturonan acetylesterase [Pontibacter ummariensis]PRY10908.1 lysophospholipase L1-like esterase [Pontibacter ummariensis]SNS75699.1 Lysophospholipase L1 [Pontibacter ummariensis]
MNKRYSAVLLLLCCLVFAAFSPSKKKPVKVYLIGDSTVADYTGNYDEKDYRKERYPIAGWGQVFQPFMSSDSLSQIRNIIKADSVIVLNKARGGRSTRTFFEEGRWSEVYKALQKGDVVMMQFGHNDAAENKPERYTNVNAYKEYLRLYVNQARQKGALPIILTPVNRNYPWKDGKLSSVHGEYPQAAKDVAKELNVPLIDLTQLSIDAFTAKGQDYVTNHYFMNLPAGKYEAYPEGEKDNTHFQPEGARAVAQLVFNGMKQLKITEASAKK